MGVLGPSGTGLGKGSDNIPGALRATVEIGTMFRRQPDTWLLAHGGSCGSGSPEAFHVAKLAF